MGALAGVLGKSKSKTWFLLVNCGVSEDALTHQNVPFFLKVYFLWTIWAEVENDWHGSIRAMGWDGRQ